MAVVLFLARSGARLGGDDIQLALETLILDLVEGRIGVKQLKGWFKERIVRSAATPS